MRGRGLVEEFKWRNGSISSALNRPSKEGTPELLHLSMAGLHHIKCDSGAKEDLSSASNSAEKCITDTTKNGLANKFGEDNWRCLTTYTILLSAQNLTMCLVPDSGVQPLLALPDLKLDSTHQSQAMAHLETLASMQGLDIAILDATRLTSLQRQLRGDIIDLMRQRRSGEELGERKIVYDQ
ncbi:11756_t:CDS:2, partial [Acaulospora colombiana]